MVKWFFLVSFILDGLLVMMGLITKLKTGQYPDYYYFRIILATVEWGIFCILDKLDSIKK
jgi:hypothetical protein